MDSRSDRGLKAMDQVLTDLRHKLHRVEGDVARVKTLLKGLKQRTMEVWFLDGWTFSNG